MPSPHQVNAGVLSGPDQIPGGLLGHGRHPHRGQLPNVQQPGEALSLAPVGLDPISRRSLQLGRATTTHRTPSCCNPRARPNRSGQPQRPPRPGRAATQPSPRPPRWRPAAALTTAPPSRHPAPRPQPTGQAHPGRPTYPPAPSGASRNCGSTAPAAATRANIRARRRPSIRSRAAGRGEVVLRPRPPSDRAGAAPYASSRAATSRAVPASVTRVLTSRARAAPTIALALSAPTEIPTTCGMRRIRSGVRPSSRGSSG
jgi:hypothetical protein